MTTQLTIRIEPELNDQLKQLSLITGHTKSSLVATAIRDFIEMHEQIAKEIKTALREADRGDFASDQERDSVFNKWLG